MAQASVLPEWLIERLVCPTCRKGLTLERGLDGDGILSHSSETACVERYPVIDGVPRMLLAPHRLSVLRAHPQWFATDGERRALGARWAIGASGRERTLRIIRAFDDEWRRFDVVDSADERIGFSQYFDLLETTAFAEDQVVLDAGCGAGRWAYQVSARGPRVIAVDLGQSVEIAARNTSAGGRVACVQGDLQALPFGRGSVDWAYSLGVLHHVEDPELALQLTADVVRDGGSMLLYLYYALDGRGPTYRALFSAVDAIRRVSSRLPRPLLELFASLVALIVYWPLARLAGLAARLAGSSFANAIPLSFYKDRSLRVMLNDSVDRFGTALERRYTKDEILQLASSAGLTDATFSPRPPYWHALMRVRH